MVAEHLQRACLENFLGTVIEGSSRSIETLLFSGEMGTEDRTPLDNDHARATAKLAQLVRERTGADLGLAVHGVPGGQPATENLFQGESYVAIDGDGISQSRTFNYAGRGLPDRRRLTLNALNLIRVNLTQKP